MFQTATFQAGCKENADVADKTAAMTVGRKLTHLQARVSQ
jgi:hypothetical protein